MEPYHGLGSQKMGRRDFMCACGCSAAGMALGSAGVVVRQEAGLAAGAVAGAETASTSRGAATVRGAFLYAPTEVLKKAGYYSWPGSGFDAEGHQRQYAGRITEIGRKLGMRIAMDAAAVSDSSGVRHFVDEVKASTPDGLLLIPFQKAQWESVCNIVRETGLPTVIVATAGVLLSTHIRQMHRTPGVYLISSLDNFEAVEFGMKMIQTAWRMRRALILSLGGNAAGEKVVGPFNTRVRVLPLSRFADEYRRAEAGDEVKEIAAGYRKGAVKVVEPSDADLIGAARACVACRRVVAGEQADAVTMDCLGGIRQGAFPPPCMGYMDLRDAGIIAGCQNEIEPTLTMMMVQYLFDKPGFQQNPFMDTERNLFLGSHCTSPSRLDGAGGSPAPYALRSHAEAGVGAVPEVIWPVGREATIACLLRGEKPGMLVYSGKVVGRHEMPPAGGCRTNLWMTVNEVSDVCDVNGMHQTIFAGNHARQLRAFCQFMGITAAT